MDREKVIKKDGKVFSLNQVEFVGEYCLDQDYTIELYSFKRIIPTGLLTIGRLIAPKKGLPEFIFRWDEKEEALDVDIDNVEEKVRKKFRQCKNGYAGHHSKRILSEKGRVFRVEVSLPAKKIFQGNIKVSVSRKIEFSSTIHFEPKAEVKFVKGKK